VPRWKLSTIGQRQRHQAALKKPLILLAQAGTKLPFDIQGYRTVFYEDVIGGEVKLAENLRKQLKV
jgi:hypothetical protein